jgi:hypothetical protein
VPGTGEAGAATGEGPVSADLAEAEGVEVGCAAVDAPPPQALRTTALASAASSGRVNDRTNISRVEDCGAREQFPVHISTMGEEAWNWLRTC